MGYRSLKVIQTGTIRKLGCSFLFSPSIVIMAVSLTLYSPEAIIVPSATSNNMKLVHWLLMAGCYIRYSEEGTERAQAPPRCTNCNSPPINGQCTNHRIAVQ